jgi:hypothetical protein
MTLRLVSSNPSPAPRTMMTAAEHRESAERLRRVGTPQALELAEQHEIVARMIEHRALPSHFRDESFQ